MTVTNAGKGSFYLITFYHLQLECFLIQSVNILKVSFQAIFFTFFKAKKCRGLYYKTFYGSNCCRIVIS